MSLGITSHCMRITLIHALASSPPPIIEAFERLWPAAKLRSILDDGLAAELSRIGTLDRRMTHRFLTLGRYAASDAPDAILFTCSAFGPCIDAVRADVAPIPVRKPYDAMIAEAERIGKRVALVAWFAPTLQSMPAEFPSGMEVIPVFVEGAQSAHNAGDLGKHDRLVAQAVAQLDVDVVALAHFSIARAALRVREYTDLPVLTTPDTAVLDLKTILNYRLVI